MVKNPDSVYRPNTRKGLLIVAEVQIKCVFDDI